MNAGITGMGGDGTGTGRWHNAAPEEGASAQRRHSTQYPWFKKRGYHGELVHERVTIMPQPKLSRVGLSGQTLTNQMSYVAALQLVPKELK